MKNDPVLRSVAVLGALALAGVVAVVIAAIGIGRYDGVAAQLPFLASGVMGGLGMLGFALGIISVQLSRREAAADRRNLDALLRASADWLAAVRSDGASR